MDIRSSCSTREREETEPILYSVYGVGEILRSNDGRNGKEVATTLNKKKMLEAYEEVESYVCNNKKWDSRDKQNVCYRAIMLLNHTRIIDAEETIELTKRLGEIK